jgi:hydroxymethylpyrimidine/phosphomethylpyrimidine kinase
MGLTDTLGAAVAALLANGQEPAEAAREAQEYVFQAARAAFRPGMGAYLPDRFFWARSNDADDESETSALPDESAGLPGEARH